MNRDKVIEKVESEKAKYKVKCPCGHTVKFYPIYHKTKILCVCCGNYVYKDEKEKFKELLNKKMKEGNL